MTLKWHIWLVIEFKRTNQELLSWANRNFQNNNTSGRRNLHSPTPTLSLFLAVDYSLGTNFFPLPSLPQPLKSKIAAMIFVKKILSTRSPKLGCAAILPARGTPEQHHWRLSESSDYRKLSANSNMTHYSSFTYSLAKWLNQTWTLSHALHVMNTL